jgi:membrane associated rhomboid family serine protease
MRLLSRTRALRMLLLLLSIALPAGARQTQPAAVVVHRPTDTAQPLQSKRIMPYHRQRDKRLTGYLLAGNCAVFVLLSRSPHAFAFLAKNDAKIMRNGQYHRLLTSTFLHSGAAHLFVNMNSLNALGGSAEPWFGTSRFAATYLISGVAGNLLSLQLGTAPLSVGASGAIFGLLGAWGVFLKRHEDFFAARGVSVRSSLTSLLQSCALTAAIGFSPGSRVDNMGHIGGLLGGAACSYCFGPRLRRVRVNGRSGVSTIVIDDPVVALFPPSKPPQQNALAHSTPMRKRRPDGDAGRRRRPSRRRQQHYQDDAGARRVAGL